MRNPLVLAVALAVVGLLTVPLAATAQGGFHRLPPGAIFLGEPLVVGAGETLEIGPGTYVTGPGRIEVWGSLLVNGTAAAPANLSVPVLLMGASESRVEHGRFFGVNATALTVQSGRLTLRDALFEANGRAILAGGNGIVEGDRVAFRDHVGEALYLQEAADVRVANSTFLGNGRAATVFSVARFHLNDSVLRGNGQHVVVDLGPWSGPAGEILLARNFFQAPETTPVAVPAILLRHDPPLVSGHGERTVHMEGNRIEGARVALRAEGRGLVVESRNDTLVDNEVGISIELATVRMRGATLGNVRDVDGGGRFDIDGVTYVRNGEALATAPSSRLAWLPWALGGGALLALVFTVALVPRLARRPAPPPPEEPVLVERAPPPAAPDLAVPMSPLERRILEDILAHPGTAQRAIADRLGYTRQALHYHVKKLEARGLVTKAAEGRETRCHVPVQVARALAARPATQTGSDERA